MRDLKIGGPTHAPALALVPRRGESAGQSMRSQKRDESEGLSPDIVRQDWRDRLLQQRSVHRPLRSPRHRRRLGPPLRRWRYLDKSPCNPDVGVGREAARLPACLGLQGCKGLTISICDGARKKSAASIETLIYHLFEAKLLGPHRSCLSEV